MGCGNDENKTAVEAYGDFRGDQSEFARTSTTPCWTMKICLPVDLAPMLILDASGRQRQTYEFWFKNRGKLRFLESPQKSYEGLTIHHWNRGAGKDAQKKDGQKIARGVASAINGTFRA